MDTMEKERAVEFFDLVVRNRMLPEKLNELVPMSFMGQAAVEFYRTKVKALKDLGLSERQQKKTLGDGQDAGKMLLTIEAKIGELSYQEQQAQGARGHLAGTTVGSAPSGKPPKHERIGLPSRKSLSNAQAIHRNPEAVAKVIAEAEENEDIPTKTAVINRIRYEQEKARTKKAPTSELVLTLQQADYVGTLDKIIRILPPYPPKDWNQKSLAYASAKAEIIIGRLEVFRHGNRKSISE